MSSARKLRWPLVISFSGLDGSGKTTQIENLCSLIQSLGLRQEGLAFWDNIVVLCRYREGFVHVVYKSERGIGAADKPVERRDKNIRTWYMNIARHGLYLLDALHLMWVVGKARRSRTDVVIVDRYMYDELANLPLDNPLTRAFVRFVNFIIPKPNIAYLLDTDPVAARARKPEYPVEFLHQSRRRYFLLADLVGTMTVIPPLPLTDAKREVEQHFLRLLGENAPRQSPHLDTATA
jgi:thymidylate kinase